MHMNMENETYPRRRRTPSFSSTLLDAICRSIDESKSNLDKDQQLGLFKETNTHNTSKQSNLNNYKHNNHRISVEKSSNKERMNLRRAVMIEDWMEKQSSLSSSESSSGAVFSSSEADTTHKLRPRISKHMNINSEKIHQQQQKPNREGGFTKTKLRALKIYGIKNESPPEPKITSLTTVIDRAGHQKVKQPISPGSRIASFLSSIFNSGNVKKAKMCYVGAVEDVSFEHKSSKSPCFSSTTTASSFSRRSCMSKSAHSSEKGKNKNGIKSVRFYPVSVILGEDSQKHSCHRYSYENDPSLLPLPSVTRITRGSSIKELKKNYVMTKEKEAEAASLDFIKGCENSSGKGDKFDFRDFYDNEGDEDDDDAWSYSSSDLFELDHIIGARRYQEELPVYETTNLETNKAIANGLRL